MDNLELFLQGKADTTITYTQTPNPAMNVPYELTVKGFKKFYLNRNEQPDLTTEEQLILLCASGNDIYSTPSNTVAGIFKAREFVILGWAPSVVLQYSLVSPETTYTKVLIIW